MNLKSNVLQILVNELGATIIDDINNAGYVTYSSEIDTLSIAESQEQAEEAQGVEYEVFLEVSETNELREILDRAKIPCWVE